MTSYQKLKEENKRLREEIHTLIYRPDSNEAIMIRMAHDLHERNRKPQTISKKQFIEVISALGVE